MIEFDRAATAPPPRSAPAAMSHESGAFDAVAELFDRFTAVWEGVDSTFSDWLIGNLPARAGSAVDLGCGGGRHTVLLADRFEQVLAVDVAESMLHIARRDRARAHITYQRADVLAVDPAQTGKFDLVLSVHTLHHVGDPDVVLPHVRSLVAPGGTAILADIVDPGDWANPAFHLERAFADARAAYQLTGDRKAAITVLDLLLHPQWLTTAATDTPLTRPQFQQRYAATFPGATITHDLHPLMAGAVWHNQAQTTIPPDQHTGTARDPAAASRS
jgi:2-polyprenyl-3-methyl-5-hydroxy-6-metoxy-1,4-benzoquinol methylase